MGGEAAVKNAQLHFKNRPPEEEKRAKYLSASVGSVKF
jgi:hypothetical protein